jgi:hypothetical protein
MMFPEALLLPIPIEFSVSCNHSVGYAFCGRVPRFASAGILCL